jgi:hypothetical protein
LLTLTGASQAVAASHGPSKRTDCFTLGSVIKYCYALQLLAEGGLNATEIGKRLNPARTKDAVYNRIATMDKVTALEAEAVLQLKAHKVHAR